MGGVALSWLLPAKAKVCNSCLGNASLLHSRFLCRQAMLLPTEGGALRDDPKNGCVAD